MNWKVGIVGLLALALLLQGVAAAEIMPVPVDPGKIPINPIKKPYPGIPEPSQPIAPAKSIDPAPAVKDPLEPAPEPPKIDPGKVPIINNSTQGTPIKAPLPWEKKKPPKKIVPRPKPRQRVPGAVKIILPR